MYNKNDRNTWPSLQLSGAPYPCGLPEFPGTKYNRANIFTTAGDSHSWNCPALKPGHVSVRFYYGTPMALSNYCAGEPDLVEAFLADPPDWWGRIARDCLRGFQMWRASHEWERKS